MTKYVIEEEERNMVIKECWKYIEIFLIFVARRFVGFNGRPYGRTDELKLETLLERMRESIDGFVIVERKS